MKKRICTTVICYLVVSLSFGWFISCPLSAETAKTETAKESEQWPKTVKEAVAKILSTMKEADKETVRRTPKQDLIKHHHGWGTGIRNEFGLWRGNVELLKDTKTNHPDDASMVIIEAVWEELQKK
jgi:hypothetical protein